MLGNLKYFKYLYKKKYFCKMSKKAYNFIDTSGVVGKCLNYIRYHMIRNKKPRLIQKAEIEGIFIRFNADIVEKDKEYQAFLQSEGKGVDLGK